jgi:hypothetical protein
VTGGHGNDEALQSIDSQHPPQIPEISELRPIGHGGFATVYRGIQARLGREVAVKVFHATVRDPRVRQQFDAECTAVGRLPTDINIVHIYTSGIVPGSGRPYLVMELCRGSLDERIADRGALPAGEVAAMGYRLALALAGVHRAALLHRDITPRNVLFRQSGQPVLADFGLSLHGEHADRNQDYATWAHAAPEIWSGGASSRSDIYGLGSTLYTALTGTPPFPRQPGEDDSAYAARISTEPVPPLGDAPVPDGLRALIIQMLAKDPRDRPVDADAVAIGLAPFCSPGLAEPGNVRPDAGHAGAGPSPRAGAASGEAPQVQAPWGEATQVRTPRVDQTHGTDSGDATRLRPTRQVPDRRAPGPGAGGGRRWLLIGAAALVLAVVVGAAVAVKLPGHRPSPSRPAAAVSATLTAPVSAPPMAAGATGSPAAAAPAPPAVPGSNPTHAAGAPADPAPGPPAQDPQPGQAPAPPPTGSATLDISNNYAWARGSVSWNGTMATANGQIQDTPQYDSRSWLRIAYSLNVNGTWKVQYAQPDPFTNVANGESKTFAFSIGGPVKDVQWDLCSQRLGKTYCTGWK